MRDRICDLAWITFDRILEGEEHGGSDSAAALVGTAAHRTDKTGTYRAATV